MIGASVLSLLYRPAPRGGYEAGAVLGLALIAATVLMGGWHVVASGILVVAASVMAVCTVRYSLHRSGHPATRTPWRSRRGRIVLGLAGALVVVLNAALLIVIEPLANAPDSVMLSHTTADYSTESPTDAFEHMHDLLGRAYAMGDRKRVDWTRLHAETARRIAAAEAARDRSGYYLALREYLWSLPDGHVGLRGPDGGLRERVLRGGFGLTLVTLDDGRTIASSVLDASPAATAGMTWGARVLQWNGLAIDDALAATPVTWNRSPPATMEGLRNARLTLLTRAPVGTFIRVGFVNPGDATTRVGTLTAVEDGLAPLEPGDPFSLNTAAVAFRVLDGPVGYLRIRAAFPTLAQWLPAAPSGVHSRGSRPQGSGASSSTSGATSGAQTSWCRA